MSAVNQRIAVIHAGFALTGVVTTLLGPILPVLSAKWGLNDAQAGYLFTAQFAGSITGVALTTRLTERLGYVHLLVVGFLLMCIGVAALGVSAYQTGILSVFCYGVALGITIPTVNLFVSDLNPGRRAAALNLLNFAWCIGAVVSPPIIAILVRSGSATEALIGLSLMLGITAFALAKLRTAVVVGKREPLEHDSGAPTRVWNSPFFPLIGALIFIYVGTENAIAGWVASYALRMTGSAEALWSLAPSVFWAALLIGRVIAAGALRHVREEKLVLFGLVTASLGSSILLLSAGMTSLLTGIALAGAGLAPVFPTTIALLSHCFGALAPRVAGFVFALAGLGGATLPWLVGWISNHYGGLRVGFGVPASCNLAMIGLQVAIIVILNRQPRTLAVGLPVSHT